jgi:hypothetical protein
VAEAGRLGWGKGVHGWSSPRKKEGEGKKASVTSTLGFRPWSSGKTLVRRDGAVGNGGGEDEDEDEEEGMSAPEAGEGGA